MQDNHFVVERQDVEEAGVVDGQAGTDVGPRG